jgi:hypothetical protein
MRGLTLQGGLDTGRTFQDACAVKAALPGWVRSPVAPFPATSPTDPYCSFATLWLTQIKGLGSYSVPKVGIQLGVGFQSMPGPQIVANYQAPNSLIQPSLGRPLSGGVTSVSVNLVQPGSLYGERMNSTDFRVSKTLHVANRGRLRLDLDLFNMFNASTVLIQNSAYSPTTTTWNTPQTIIAPRLVKVGAQFDF